MKKQAKAETPTSTSKIGTTVSILDETKSNGHEAEPSPAQPTGQLWFIPP